MAAEGPVVEEGQGPGLGDQQQVRSPVVVEVAHRQAPSHARGCPGLPGRLSDIDEPAVPATHHQRRGHVIRIIGAIVVDVAIGRGQVEPAVVVGIEQRDAEAEQEAPWRGQPDGGGLDGQILISRRLTPAVRRALSPRP